MQKNEEKFKAVYHGILAAASLAEVFTAKTTLRKTLLVLASGWHARCTWEHIQEVQKENSLLDSLKDLENKPCIGQWHYDLGFPNRPLYPCKTVVFDQERCTAAQEVEREFRQELPESEGQTEALPEEVTKVSAELPSWGKLPLVSGRSQISRPKKATGSQRESRGYGVNAGNRFRRNSIQEPEDVL